MPITYKFSYSPNEVGTVIDELTIASREGWQYPDIYNRVIADTMSKKKIEVPYCAYVHKVYEYGDFDQLLLNVVL